jgi:hypothetical protein
MCELQLVTYLAYSVWLQAGLPGDQGSIPGRGERIFPLVCIQTGSGVNPASCTMGTGFLSPGLKRPLTPIQCRGRE